MNGAKPEVLDYLDEGTVMRAQWSVALALAGFLAIGFSAFILWTTVRKDKIPLQSLSPTEAMNLVWECGLPLILVAVDVIVRKRTWWRVWPDRLEVWDRKGVRHSVRWSEVREVVVLPFGIRVRGPDREYRLYWALPRYGLSITEHWKASRTGLC